MKQRLYNRPNPLRHDNLPQYNSARGSIDTLVLTPPFSFQDVTLYYFPLRAEARTLQLLIDRCLNTIGGPQAGRHYFEVSAPYVYMALGDYDQIKPELTNLGWIDQYELAFLVPLNWYRRRRDGKLVFHAPATFAPFLFVDDTLSMANARDVYGWPKCMGALRSSIDGWFGRPSEQQTQVRMYDRGLMESLRGEPNPYPPLVFVSHENPSVFSRFPPKIRNVPNPLWVASQWARAAYDAVSFLSGGASRRRLPREMPLDMADLRPNLGPQLAAVRNSLGFIWNQWLSGDPFVANNINLKQIPVPSASGASQPDASYKAITNAPIGITSFHASGILGFDNLLYGQLNAGYQIGIRRQDSGSIVSLLGLSVTSSFAEGSNDFVVDMIEPILPFWMRVDMEYQAGRVLAKNSALPNQRPLPFVLCTGTTLQLIRLPITSRSAKGSVIALPAKAEVLETFIKGYLGELTPTGLDIQLAGSCVYMITMKNEGLRSLDAPTSLFESTEIYFTVPVKWQENGVLQFSFVVAYAFSTNPSLVSTFVEVLGVPALLAEIKSEGNNWVTETEGVPVTQDVLRMSMQFLPVYYAGLSDGWREIVSITRDYPLPVSHAKGWENIRDRYGRVIEEKHDALVADMDHPMFQKAYDLFVEKLKRGQPLPLLTLKQSRDTEQPDRACLQALVKFDVSFSNLSVYEPPELQHVAIHRYATVNIAQVLGLEVKSTHIHGEDTIDVFQPCHVATFTGQMEYSSGDIWYERIDGRSWVRNGRVSWPLAPTGGAGNSVDEAKAAISALREPLSVFASAVHDGWLGSRGSTSNDRPAHAVRADSFGNEAVSAAFFSNWEHSSDGKFCWKKPGGKDKPKEGAG